MHRDDARLRDDRKIAVLSSRVAGMKTSSHAPSRLLFSIGTTTRAIGAQPAAAEDAHGLFHLRVERAHGAQRSST